MKTIAYWATVLVLFFTACTPKYQTVSIDKFERIISRRNVIIVDVRAPQEFAEGHIAGALNIDWNAGNFAYVADELLDDDETIAVYCSHAKRSRLAAAMLNQMGYRHVVELQGGFETWMAAGKPIEKGVLVPYVDAEHYFVRNDAVLPIPVKIVSQETFDSCFSTLGMVDDDHPTPIDFSKQFVIVVTLPATNRDIEIDDERLLDDGKTLTFEYSVDRDFEKNKFVQTPLQLVVVDRKYERPNVVLKKVANH